MGLKKLPLPQEVAAKHVTSHRKGILGGAAPPPRSSCKARDFPQEGHTATCFHVCPRPKQYDEKLQDKSENSAKIHCCERIGEGHFRWPFTLAILNWQP